LKLGIKNYKTNPYTESYETKITLKFISKTTFFINVLIKKLSQVYWENKKKLSDTYLPEKPYLFKL